MNYQFNTPIKLLSFDLDNALYDNQPTIEKAEQASVQILEKYFRQQNQPFDYQQFWTIRGKLVAQKKPEYDNLSELRRQVLSIFCRSLNHPETIIDETFQAFMQARSQIQVESTIHEMLKILQQHFILVSVSNGNCEIEKTALAPYFKKNYTPVKGYRAKPHPEMLQAAMQDFNVNQSQICHIGDTRDTDGLAAENAGVDYYYFSPFEKDKNLTEQCQSLCQYFTKN